MNDLAILEEVRDLVAHPLHRLERRRRERRHPRPRRLIPSGRDGRHLVGLGAWRSIRRVRSRLARERISANISANISAGLDTPPSPL